MKRSSTLFLRVALLAMGTAVLALCIFALPAMWRAVAGEYPHITYVFYGILSALYVAAVPFYVALFQAWKLLNLTDTNKAFSSTSVKALRRISYCGIGISLVFIAILPLMYKWAQNDDAPGLIVIGMIMAGAALAVAAFAGVAQKLLA